ncbi:MAG: hypothetical protein QM820_43555 [Minicystis sp.]
MGTNASSLSVRVGDAIEAEQVEAAIVASYEARGAQLVGRRYVEQLERQPEPPERAELGIAVGPVVDGWVTVRDSFGYTSDARLAGDLARELDTTVFRYTLLDAAGYEALERFGAPLDPREAPADTTEYRHLDARSVGHRFLLLDGVTRDAYANGPSIEVTAECPSCGYDAGWTPGREVPWAPRKKALFTLRARRKGSRWPRFLFQMRCPNCDDALGWARATIEAGMLADVRRLSRPRVAAFDVALTSQRAAIEALSPSLRAPRPKALDLSRAPQQALESALAAVLPKLRRAKPAPLSWVFAPDRAALISAVERAFPAFSWQPRDLPGPVALQLRAWLGPKPGAPALASFLDRVKDVLGPEAFARQARHPETHVWVVAVSLRLPDGTWAALTLLDKHVP